MKEHPTYSGYFVNEQGKVFSTLRGDYHELTPADNGIGYLRVRVMVNTKKYHRYVHRLIAETYLPNPDNLSEVNHLDGNKSNNSLSNLEWCSRQENMTHYHKTLKPQKYPGK
jgi:hypothetical protein